MTTLSIRNSISWSPWPGLPRKQKLPRIQAMRIIRGFLLISLALAVVWFALSPTARAVDPPPDGGYLGNNTAEGEDALFSLTTGYGNTANGFDALYHSTTGSYNTANGYEALYNNTTGNYNTANGALALTFNTTANNNTATGFEALYSNIGTENTAIGTIALYRNTTGNDNAATGFAALVSNTTGSRNVAIGANALYTNQIGGDNTAHGYQALESNTTGTNNTATGLNALNLNTTGSYNAASGAYALYNDTAGYNTADGCQALYKNTAGTHNIALGYNAGYSLTTGSNNIDIGNPGLAAEANTIRIGSVRTQTNTYIAGISGVTVAGGVGVIVDDNGHLGTVVSSERFKDAIKPMDKASEAILALKPVTFRYRKEFDPEGIPQFGLVAEQVEKVDPDLVARDEEGKPYTVRYEAVNAMLLNEFLKEHRKMEDQASINQQQEATIVDLESQLQAVTSILKEQTARIQKVSAQLAADKSTARLMANNPQKETPSKDNSYEKSSSPH